MASIRSPKALTTNRGRVIDRRDANPCKEVTVLSRRPPVALFLNDNIVNLNDDIEFAHFVSVSSMMY